MEILDFEKIRSFSKSDFEIRFEKYKKFLNYIGNPQLNLKTIIITGSTGKGSTAEYISRILQTQKIKTGLYTSPHIFNISERIKINGLPISENKIEYYKNKIIKLVNDFNKNLKLDYTPTFFELLTITAFLYFIDSKVDIAILEVGLGGRLDATNVTNPVINIISSICKDHTNFLGESIKKIAKEKVEVIKENSFTILADNERSVIRIVKSKCKKMNSSLFIQKRDFDFKIIEVKDKICRFSICDKEFEFSNVSLGAINSLTLAYFAVKIFFEKILKRKFNTELLNRLNLQFPARFQVMRYKNKTFIIDGAHNKKSAETLVESLKMYNYFKPLLIFSILSDKEIDEVLEIFSKITNEIVIAKINHPREADINLIYKYAKKYFNKITIMADLDYIIELALKSQNDYILFSGSFYLCAEVLKRI